MGGVWRVANVLIIIIIFFLFFSAIYSETSDCYFKESSVVEESRGSIHTKPTDVNIQLFFFFFFFLGGGRGGKLQCVCVFCCCFF